jgi:CDP-diacylglycerol--glycerol-3-phosphate 3-phosphatidyltransferase
MFDGRFRAPVERAVKPIGDGLRRTGLTPDHLTLIGLLLAVAATVVIALGGLRGGLVLVILAALPDLLDGALAKASDNASQRGAFFDSVADRVTDMLLLGGVGWYLATEYGSHAALLPFAVMGLSALISYQRAKAESLGLSAKGGLMERAERVILLCIGLLFDSILIPVLWVMLVLTAITAVQRFVGVWNQAVAAPVVLERQAARRSRRFARRTARAHRRTEVRRRRPRP